MGFAGVWVKGGWEGRQQVGRWREALVGGFWVDALVWMLWWVGRVCGCSGWLAA